MNQNTIIGVGMENLTSSKLSKKSDKSLYCYSVYVNHMQSILLKYQVNESQAGIKVSGEISTTSDV